MEAAAAWEGEDGFDDGATCGFDFGLGFFESLAVEDDEGGTGGGGGGLVRLKETAVEALVGEGAIGGAVVFEAPAEGFDEKLFGLFEVAGGELDVVDFFVVVHRKMGLRLAEHQYGNEAGADHGCGGAAEKKVADAGVAISSHDEEGNLGRFEGGGDAFFGFAGIEVRDDLVSGVAQFLGGVFEGGWGLGVADASHVEVAGEALEEGLVDGVGDGFFGAGAAIEREEELVDGAERSGGDENGLVGAANDALKVAA